MVGCQTTPSEQVYTDVSVGALTVSIPDDWERPDELDDLAGELYATISLMGEQTIQFDAFSGDSDDVALVLVMMDMVAIAESGGADWGGWDAELEEIYMTKEEYVEIIQGSLVGEFSELTRETHQQLTVQGHEAWESIYAAESEGDPVHICLLVVFTEDDLGMLILIVQQNKWSKHQENWTTIRDSVVIS